MVHDPCPFPPAQKYPHTPASLGVYFYRFVVGVILCPGGHPFRVERTTARMRERRMPSYLFCFLMRSNCLCDNLCHFGEEDGVDGFAEDEVVDVVVVGFFDR